MRGLFIVFIFVVASSAFIKSILFWVWIWQIKEYRLDRFLAEYGTASKLVRFWIGAGGKKFQKPKWTSKAMGIALFSFFVIEIAALVMPYNLDYAVIFLPLFYLLLYAVLPVLVCAFVLLFKIPTYIVRQSAGARAAAKIRKMPQLIVIGITGSYGKSSTKEFLSSILERKFRVVKTPANINTEIGIFHFILNDLVPQAEIFVVEMGAYRQGEIKNICRVVRPKIGILTGISEQHLALFGSLENTKKAKYELIESLPADGVAVFNGENKIALELAEKWKGKGIIYRKSIFPITKKLPPHYEVNLSGAIDVAKYLGMTSQEIDEVIRSMDFDSMVRAQYVGRRGASIINDTYSANPDGVLAALDFLASLPQKRKIVIMPTLIELGSAAVAVHEKIGHKIRDVCDLAIITTYDYFKDIERGAGDGFDKLTTSKVIFENNPEAIKAILDKKITKDTAILLEGRLPTEVIAYVSETHDRSKTTN